MLVLVVVTQLFNFPLNMGLSISTIIFRLVCFVSGYPSWSYCCCFETQDNVFLFFVFVSLLQSLCRFCFGSYFFEFLLSFWNTLQFVTFLGSFVGFTCSHLVCFVLGYMFMCLLSFSSKLKCAIFLFVVGFYVSML
jgi:hypothetical protein